MGNPRFSSSTPGRDPIVDRGSANMNDEKRVSRNLSGETSYKPTSGSELLPNFPSTVNNIGFGSTHGPS